MFDGASKGNPGAAGGGGILMNPEGSIDLTYSWGLGTDTNNISWALALWQGLHQDMGLNIKELMIFKDSILIINALATNSIPMHMKLHHLLKKNKILLSSFHFVQVFLVLMELNGEVDKEANLDAPLGKGTLILNGLCH